MMFWFNCVFNHELLHLIVIFIFLLSGNETAKKRAFQSDLQLKERFPYFLFW